MPHIRAISAENIGYHINIGLMYQINFENFPLETSVLVFIIFIKEPNLVAPSVYDAESSVSKRQIIILIIAYK